MKLQPAQHFTIGGAIAGGFAVLFGDFFRFLAVSAAIAVPVGLALALAVMVGPAEETGTGFRVAGMPEIDIGAILYWLALVLLFLAGYAAALTAVTHGAVQALKGEKVGIGASLRSGIRSLPQAFGAILIFFLIVGSLSFAVAWCMVTLVTELSVAWRLPGYIDWGKLVLNGGIGGVALVLLLLFLVASWVFVPALAAERAGPIGCFRRSFVLTRGRRWKVLAVVLLVAAANGGATFLVAKIQETGAVDFGEWLDYALTGLLTALGVTISAAGYQRLRAEKEGGASADLARVFD